MTATMFELYETIGGDMVDDIAFRRFGASSDIVQAIYEANPGLAALGPLLPPGVTIKLPLPALKDRVEMKRVWS